MFPSPNFDTPFDSLLKIMSSSSSSSSLQNPTPPSLLFNFPSPFLDEHESPLNQIFFQNQLQRPNLGKSKAEEIDQIPSTNISAAAAPQRRRKVGKKDRHSKICTAQGIRDRRMRLSLQVARKFFDLQDMLGYDKASKTIEWLFTQSKSAINELVEELRSPPNASDVKSESFLSEREDVSGIEEINSSLVSAQNIPAEMAKPYSSKRESREKARARARCRTREKMMVKRLRFTEEEPNPSDNNNDNNNTSNQIIPLEGEEIRVSSYSPLSDVGMIEKCLGNTTSFASDYQCTAAAASDYSEFLGNWEVLSSERSNCFQLSFAGNLNSVFSATPEFP